jgi:hypothetical protein
MTILTPAAYRHLLHLAVVTHPDDSHYSLREPATDLKPLLAAGYAERHVTDKDRYRVTREGLDALEESEDAS